MKIIVDVSINYLHMISTMGGIWSPQTPVCMWLFCYSQEDFYCYHYMNCFDNQDFEVEVTDYAVYVNVGHDNVEMCVI